MGRPPLKLLEMNSHILYMLCTEMSSIVDVCMKLFEIGIKKLKKREIIEKLTKATEWEIKSCAFCKRFLFVNLPLDKCTE